MRNMTRIALAAVLAITGGLAPARAADLTPVPVKASPLSFLGAYTGQGLYVGLNMGGGGGSASVATPGLAANVVDLQGLIGVTVGYAWAMPGSATFAAIEADFDMMNLSTGNTAGLTMNGPIDLEQRILYGFPLKALLDLIPGLSLGTLPPFNALPAGVTASNSHMYVFAGIDEKDVSASFGAVTNKLWLIAPEIGFGNRVQLSNGFAMDTSMAVQFDSKGFCVGQQAGLGCGNLGTNYIGKLKFLY